MIDYVDEATMGQITSFINNPLFRNYVAMMPDTHYGKGAAVGFTMELGDNVIPNIVGVDQSCGVLSFALRTEYFDDIPKIFDTFNQRVRRDVPMGNRVHKTPLFDMEKHFDWDHLMARVLNFTTKFNERYGTNFVAPSMNFKYMEDLCKRVGCDFMYALCSIGTMGGGNHFIEIGKETLTNVPWVTIHSGSRNLGKKTAEYWQEVAVKNDAALRKEAGDIFHASLSDIPPREREAAVQAFNTTNKSKNMKNLEPLYGKDMYRYMVDAIFMNQYAATNREVMMTSILKIIANYEVAASVHTVHNYIDYNDFIIRKGAVSANIGEFFVLPFNFEDGILICRGKGNPNWNYSAPHGAGRIGSRREAKDAVAEGKVSEADVRQRLKDKGIYTTTLPHDELPEAYKSSVTIEEAIEPTAEIIHRIKPVISFKSKK